MKPEYSLWTMCLMLIPIIELGACYRIESRVIERPITVPTAELGRMSNTNDIIIGDGAKDHDIGSLLRRTRLTNVGYEKSQSAERDDFFPQWCVLLAPIGAIGVWFTWGRVRNECGLTRDVWIFALSAILCMYGLARLIMP
jgi:hypothetical protein